MAIILVKNEQQTPEQKPVKLLILKISLNMQEENATNIINNTANIKGASKYIFYLYIFL